MPAMTDSDKKTPLYRRVAQDLMGDIATMPVGSILPTEVELAARLGVSRATIRDAMEILVEHRMVERVKRLGTRILRNTPGHRYVQHMDGLAHALEFAGQSLMRIDDTAIVEGSGGEPGLAALPNATGQWLRVTGTRRLVDDDAPSTWTRVFVPGRYQGIAPLLHGELDSVYAVIERVYSLKVARLRHRVTAVALPGYASGALGLPAGAPVLQVSAWLHEADGALVEYVRSLHHPEKVSIDFSAAQSS
ncbi:GntR family transcriptional regulator [Bordetella parapertussis]|uniref:Transcriptional regulator n=6 Tax=Bordetella TaxID=517 RepID=A0A0H3LNX8_BORBR|nr:GntR family transcriptional regulator [Bordetella bronchiseptica]AOB39822.1 GntR family transcriptional regulator [Bordetella parapertussis]KAK65533.1 UbiC transcription regulator-associated domain protein [Bordetella bronchiseptica 980-2]KDB64845.1 UbiC transcription regulator-associated domain protein [Bordetella bronchiseptica B18-5 (C3)]KDB70480.1 UbiC transcription regulator-associated domain protein [Bordetella bronchiseptica B20-10725633]KDC07329.1 UbiC transcription regulator-associ